MESMNRAFATRRIARIGFAAVLLSLAAGFGIANAQTGAPMEAPATLSAVDFNFVGQANLVDRIRRFDPFDCRASD
jgi:hypothetical protein